MIRFWEEGGEGEGRERGRDILLLLLAGAHTHWSCVGLVACVSSAHAAFTAARQESRFSV